MNKDVNYIVAIHVIRRISNKHEVEFMTINANDQKFAEGVAIDFCLDWYSEDIASGNVDFKILFSVPSSFVYASLITDMRPPEDVVEDCSKFKGTWLYDLVKSDFESAYRHELL